MLIRTSTTLRKNYLEISKLARENREPIYITNNGVGDLVVMSTEAFEARDEELRLRAKLEFAEMMRLAGNTESEAAVRARLNAIYGSKQA